MKKLLFIFLLIPSLLLGQKLPGSLFGLSGIIDIDKVVAEANSLPTGLTASWINDYVRLVWDGNSSSYEVYHNVNDSASYSLVGTYTADSAYIYDWQNAELKYKIRGIKSGDTTEYTAITDSIISPLVWKTNQSSLNTATFNNLNLPTGDTVTVYWGDGNHDHYFGTNTNKTHTYGATGNPYYVQLVGDVSMGGKLNTITQIYANSWTTIYGDITKWVIPTTITAFKMVGTASNSLSGSALKIVSHPVMQYLYVTSSNVTGELNTINLANSVREINLSSNPYITSLPRGNYRYIGTFNFNGCSVPASELLSWTSFLHTFFEATTPLANGAYDVGGSRMGIFDPTETNLAATVGHYTEHSKTCTFATYWPTIAYSDISTKVDIPLTTFDGSGQTVHPSVIDVGVGGWAGYRYWMGNTPYPYSDPDQEKLSLWASTDGLTWVVPAGITNPVISGSKPDPELYFENDTMYMFYVGTGNTIAMVRSHNGITWTSPKTVNDGSGDTQPISPMVIKVGSTYYMYYIDNTGTTTRTIKRKSISNIIGNYASSENITLEKNGTTGWWHGDVLMVGENYYICISQASTKKLWIAKSADGLTFTKETDATIIENYGSSDVAYYKPTMVYIGSQLYVYYSVIDDDGAWKIVRINATLL